MLDRYHEIENKEECVRHTGIKAMHQNILDWIINIGEDIHLLHQFMATIWKEYEKKRSLWWWQYLKCHWFSPILKKRSWTRDIKLNGWSKMFDDSNQNFQSEEMGKI